MKEKMNQKLLEWYFDHQRKLPWRESQNPYYIWVSEIMLQQTRVDTVIPYFNRFIQRLPNIEELSIIEEDNLLKLWEGLGYYSRVKNMQKCAKVIMEKYAGNMPEDYEELIKLPGIGFYTAGAISSIAFKKCIPAVDGNVLRIMTRLYKDYDDISKESTKKKYFNLLLQKMDQNFPGEFNQALMDLGAMICIPNGEAKCHKCPLAEYCKAYIHHCVEKLPVKNNKITRKVEEKTVLLFRYKNEIAIVKRPDYGLLASLYEYPTIENKRNEHEILSYLEEKKIPYLKLNTLAESKHLFSHIEWKMIGYEIYLEKKIPTYQWCSVIDVMEKYSIPTAYKKYTETIKEDF